MEDGIHDDDYGGEDDVTCIKWLLPPLLLAYFGGLSGHPLACRHSELRPVRRRRQLKKQGRGRADGR